MWGNTQILPDTQIVRIWNWTNFKTGKKDTQGYNETVTSSEIAKIKNTENCKHWRWCRALELLDIVWQFNFRILGSFWEVWLLLKLNLCLVIFKHFKIQVCPKYMKHVVTKIGIWMLIFILSIMASNWKQPRCPSAHD